MGGMVLCSPIESGGRAVFGNRVSWFAYRMDIFRNYEKVGKIKCPVFVMHGTCDEVVPWRNGKAIQAGCENAVDPYWVNGAGHNDMPEATCSPRLVIFLTTNLHGTIDIRLVVRVGKK